MVSRIGSVVCGALLFSFATCSVAAYAYRCEPAIGLQNFPRVEAPRALPSPGNSAETPVAAGTGHRWSPGPMPPENNQAAGYLGAFSGRDAPGPSRVFPRAPSFSQSPSRGLPEPGLRPRIDDARAVGYAPMVAPGAQDGSVAGTR
ncbi:MAG: hypothetical protein AB1646_18535 [Thermodesulfobacteriota bacterium]